MREWFKKRMGQPEAPKQDLSSSQRTEQVAAEDELDFEGMKNDLEKVINARPEEVDTQLGYLMFDEIREVLEDVAKNGGLSKEQVLTLETLFPKAISAAVRAYEFRCKGTPKTG